MCAYFVKDGWISKDDVLIRMPKIENEEPEFLFYDKLAVFSFDNTLIKIESNEKNYQSRDDWEMWNKNIISKMISLHGKKYSIVILSSEKRLIDKKIPVDDMKYRFDEFINKLFDEKIPVIGLFACKNNFCTKPQTGLWRMLELLFNNNGTKIDKANSFYVGSYASRNSSPAASKIGRKPKDLDYSDRAFAYNLNLNFITPDEYFLKQGIRTHRYPNMVLSLDEKEKTMENNKNFGNMVYLRKGNVNIFLRKYFSFAKQYVIILIGIHSSGKSTLANMIVNSVDNTINDAKDWTIINTQTSKRKLNTKKICKEISTELIHGNNIIIDGLNHIRADRIKYILEAKEYNNIAVLVVHFKTNLKICRHLNQIKIDSLIDFNAVPIKKTKYAKYIRDSEITNMDDDFKSNGFNKDRYKIIEHPFILNTDLVGDRWWNIY